MTVAQKFSQEYEIHHYDRPTCIQQSIAQAMRPSCKLHPKISRVSYCRPHGNILASVSDVRFTLVLTFALVVMVIFVFLRISGRPSSGRHGPAVADRHLRELYEFGYSLDNLSLMRSRSLSVLWSMTPLLSSKTFSAI